MQALISLRSFAWVRQSTLTQIWRFAPVCGLASVLCSSCTILFDSARLQCVADSDCRAVGLFDATCVANVCQPGASVGIQTPPAQGQATQPQPSAGLGGTESPSSEATSGGSRSADPARDNEAVRRNGGNVSRSPDEDGGMGGTSVAAAGGSGAGATSGRGDMSCQGPNCECTADADCIARGISGGTCVEGRCWEAEAQCEVDEDCTARGAEFMGGRCQDKQCEPSPRWRCEPPAAASATDTRELVLPVIDALQLAPVANVPIVACGKLDYMCMQPMGSAMTGMDGKAKLLVPANFSGYMQQTERSDFVPAMYFMPALLPEDGVLSNFPLVASAAFSGLAIALGTSVNRERGHAMLIVEDCKGIALAGITFTSPQADMGTTEFYIRDQIPTTSATTTPPEGDGGYANLPAGVVEITASDMKTGLVINTVTVLIRAGAITTAYIRPASRGTTVTGRFPRVP